MVIHLLPKRRVTKPCLPIALPLGYFQGNQVTLVFFKTSDCKSVTCVQNESFLALKHCRSLLITLQIVFYRLNLDLILFQVSFANSVHWNGVYANSQLQACGPGNKLENVVWCLQIIYPIFVLILYLF